MKTTKKRFSSTVKPKFLYHASINPDIKVFEPRAESVRDPNEGPLVFATPNLPFATMFLVDTNDQWTSKGRFGDVFHIVVNNKNRFQRADKGGVIYTLPNDTFYCDLDKGMGKLEWASKKEVVPIKKQHFSSGFDAMLMHSVQVYFVDEKTFLEIKGSKDHGLAILQSLQSENQRLNKNVLSFGKR